MTYLSDHELYWYWLSGAPYMGMRTMVKILESGVELEELFQGAAQNVFATVKLRAETRENLSRRANKELLTEELYTMERAGITVTTMLSNNYPALLKEIANPPTILYVKGDLGRLTDKRFCIVGSRRASRKGLAHIERVSYDLARAGVSIISGMARGIDAAAHKGALDAGGVTAAVLGCGVDIVYPRENINLYERMLETGAIISEYPPGRAPAPGNFPVRNRIMNGIASGLLVGDAGVKSGAHITVGCAVDENRDIFAMPTQSGTAEYALPNILIGDGAYVCIDSNDILNFYGWKQGNCESLANDMPAGLDFFEQELYNLLLKGDMDVQALIDATGKPPQEVNLALTKLEIKGAVERLAGNLFGIKV